jgi:signal transduction histidine kinase
MWIDHYGLDQKEREQEKAFLGFDETDAANVRALRGVFAEHAESFADQFYEHLLANPHTASFLRDPQQLAELKTLQANYFLELLEGCFDQAYFEGRLRVGLAHQRIGLEPVWYLGAYNQYVQLTFPIFARAFGDNLSAVLPHLLSLMKVIFLDIGLALRTYFLEATGQLRRHNVELQQALALYWQAQRREEQLRKLLSHEIRGGLAAMITSLEDLGDVTRDRLDATARDQLENVSRRCWSLSNLLGEMLAPEKSSGGPSWTDTAAIFENLVARFGFYRDGRAVELHLPEASPRVWADSLQLREVFANLISNAARYLDKEPGRIDIRCRPDGDFYLFSVADNGPGIPASVRERLFEPFVRGPVEPGRPPGTGLGLYFVRTIIEQGGGRIWVESEPGQGSCFWFTVPRVPPAKPAADTSGPANEPAR